MTAEVSLRAKLENALRNTVARAQREGAIPQFEVPDLSVEVAHDPSHGDFSSNAALSLARSARMQPARLAQILLDSFEDPDGLIAKARFAPPGFLNFTLEGRALQQVVLDVLSAGDSYGCQPAESTGRKILVEFVSANPTGPIHIGHARGAFLGDALARLLVAAGNVVTREFFINDYGKQMEALGRTLYQRYRESFGDPVDTGAIQYPGAYVVDIARAWAKEVGDVFRSAPESRWLPAAIAFGKAACLEAIRGTLARAGIHHEIFTSEQAIHDRGKVAALIASYRARGVLYEASEGRRRESGEKVRSAGSKAAAFAVRQEGGTFLMTATYQEGGKYVLRDDEDRVLLRPDGSPVYLAGDLAYHRDKFERGFDAAVDVFGADHGGHVARLHSGLRLLGIDEDRLRVVQVQMVRITRGDVEVKQSKRRGEIDTLDDLLDEVGPDVCRFLFLSRNPNAQFDIDLDALTAESKDNPVYYLQYGHARCSAVLDRAAKRGTPFMGAQALSLEMLAPLRSSAERELLKRMSQLPDVVVSASRRLEPHHVLHYCRELIAEFHSYYTNTKGDPILGSDLVRTQARLALVAALRQVLRSAFGILGISAPEAMGAIETEEEGLL